MGTTPEITWPITLEELEDLKKHERDGRIRERLLMVILIKKGFSVTDISHILSWNRKTIHFWIKRFNMEGPDGLRDRKRKGRNSKINYEDLKEALCKSPASCGLSNDSKWTPQLIRRYLEEFQGVKVSQNHVYWIIRRMDLFNNPNIDIKSRKDKKNL